MRCLYREKKYYCGKYLEVDIFPVFGTKRGGRKGRYKPTSEVQQKLNARNAERKFIRLINTNFDETGIRLDLTYNNEHLPESPEAAQKHMQNFFRRVKYYAKKNSLPDVKYVAVTEIGSRHGRPHHHIIMNGDVPIKELARMWGEGYVSVKPLQPDENGLEKLASYLMKKPILGKRWCASKNLIQPKVTQRDGRISQKKAKELAEHGNDARQEIERLYDGYYMSECATYYNDVNGGYYLRVHLREKPTKKNQIKRE